MRPTTALNDNVVDLNALLHPGTAFEHPRDVVSHPTLSLSEKREQFPFLPEMGFARVGLMGPAPGRPCEDISVRDASLGQLHGDAPDFLDRPADQERCFGRGRGRVFLSDGPVLAR
jgi:hypothetical protein